MRWETSTAWWRWSPAGPAGSGRRRPSCRPSGGPRGPGSPSPRAPPPPAPPPRLAWGVGGRASVEAAVGRVAADLGGLDVVVNNAGIGAQGDVAANDDDG